MICELVTCHCRSYLLSVYTEAVDFTSCDLSTCKSICPYQVYIQTNDDNLERDTQTEDIEVVTKWTQHPPEGATGCGTTDDKKNDETEAMSKDDEDKLTSFLQRSCQVNKS